MFDYALHGLAINDNGLPARGQVVDQALDLLDRALTILDGEDLALVAAKVDEARCVLREAAVSA